jgi:hypothetical protein
MTRIIMTMISFVSATYLGFASQNENNIPENQNLLITQQDGMDDQTASALPVLEKCKKKKK